jgi:nitroreductase
VPRRTFNEPVYGRSRLQTGKNTGMNATNFADETAIFPLAETDYEPLKTMPRIMPNRYAAPYFKSEPVPDEYLDAILRFAAPVSSGNNLEPWRFIVVREEQNLQRLRMTAMSQTNAGKAPVAIIAFGIKDNWKKYVDAMFAKRARTGSAAVHRTAEMKPAAPDLPDGSAAPVCLNRQVMIALSSMMLMAEALGLSAVPMQGFDTEAIKEEFKLPVAAEVIALLAIGFAQEYDNDNICGGHLAYPETIYAEQFGQAWTADRYGIKHQTIATTD